MGLFGGSKKSVKTTTVNNNIDGKILDYSVGDGDRFTTSFAGAKIDGGLVMTDHGATVKALEASMAAIDGIGESAARQVDAVKTVAASSNRAINQAVADLKGADTSTANIAKWAGMSAIAIAVAMAFKK